MKPLLEVAKAHLDVIERAYDIRIINKNEVAGWIAEKVEDNRELLALSTALNSWIFLNTAPEIKIPRKVILDLYQKTCGYA